MTEQIEISQASLDDATEILVLQKLAYQSEAQIYNDWNIPPLLQTIEEIREEFKTYMFLKAVSEHLIIGSVRARIVGNTCHIGKLIVHPEWRSWGTGTRLMTRIEQIYRDVSRFELFTGSNSVKNLYLYRKLGYKDFRRESLSSQVELIYLEKINHHLFK